MAKPVKHPEILGIQFSKDDAEYFSSQIEKEEALKAILIIMALEKVLDVATRFRGIKRWKDLLIPALETAIDVLAPNWEDAAQGLLNIQFSTAMNDAQFHLNGRYMIRGKPLKAPKGKAKQFFVALTDYYTQLRNRLAP